MYLCERMQIESYKTACSPAETLISSSLQDRDLTQHLYCCSVTLLMSRHSHGKYAMCQRTPVVGTPVWKSRVFVAPTLLNDFKMNTQDVLAFFCNGYVLALISANPPFL